MRQELAVALYAQGLHSFVKASELAGQDRFRFGDAVTQRGIARHYGQDELTEDRFSTASDYHSPNVLPFRSRI